MGALTAVSPALRRRLYLLIAYLALIGMGCSAADLLERERATPVPEVTAELQPTFTPSPVPVQTLVMVTPPADGQPGVIIVPPGMDPSSVIPALPTEPPTSTPTSPPTEEEEELAGVGPDSPLLPQQPDIGTPIALLPTATGITPQPDTTPTIEATATPAPIIVPPDTPTPTQTPTHTPTPTPFVLVPDGNLVSLRTGPDVSYPQIAQLGPNIPVAIIGQSVEGDWLEICCISGDSLWLPKQHVLVNNNISELQASLAGPPPTPTPTATPDDTPTVTPTPTATPHPFERAIGPQFFPSSNQYLTIWAKLFIGTPPLEVPAEGYRLAVRFEGVERPNALGNVASTEFFEFSATPGSGNRVEYNYKYEWFPPNPSGMDSDQTPLQLIGTGTWSVFVTDGSGTPLSEEVTFTTTPSNPNREIYLGWIRVR